MKNFVITSPSIPVAGDTMYFDGTNWVSLGPGTAGQVLVTNGPGLPPVWGPNAASGAVTENFNCVITVAVGDTVYLSAADLVDRANATSEPTMPCIGVVLSKPTAVTCVVVMSGSASGFVGLTPGATYFIGLAPGTVTTTVIGYPPGAVIQRIAYARSTTVLVVDIDRDYTVLAP